MQHLRISSTRTGARAAATSCATARPWSPWTSSTTSGASRWRLDHHCVGHLSEIMEHYRSARRARCCCTASTWATRGGPTARGAITRSSVCGAPTATGNTYYMSHVTCHCTGHVSGVLHAACRHDVTSLERFRHPLTPHHALY